MRERWIRTAAALVVLVLALSSCGPETGDGGDDTTTSSAEPTTTEDTVTSTSESSEPWPDAAFDLLMEATFGDPATGSYSEDRIDEAIRWRSRHTISNDQAMDPPVGFGHCMNGGMTDPAAVFNLNRVYILERGTGVSVLNPASGLLAAAESALGAVQEQFGVTIRQQENDRRYSVEPIELTYSTGEPTVTEFIGQVNLLTEAIGRDEINVALDYYFAPSMIYGFAADDPTPAPGDAVSETLVEASAEVAVSEKSGHTIWVADYGLPVGSQPDQWAGTIRGDFTQPSPDPGDPIPPFFAHSVMVASVAAQVAPDNPVVVVDATEEVFGTSAITVAALDNGLLEAGVLGAEPGVLNLSFGAYDCDRVVDSNGFALEVGEDNSFVAALDRVLAPYAEAMPVVAASGNDGSSVPVYPAGLDEVIAVGAVDTTVLNTEPCLQPAGIEAWSRAEAAADAACKPDPNAFAPFTNVAAPAPVPAPGVDLIVDYPALDPATRYGYAAGSSAPLDTGLVRVSGTSLAAPFYAACLLPDASLRCQVR